MLRHTIGAGRLLAFPVLAIAFAVVLAFGHATTEAKDMGKPTRKHVKFLQPQNGDQVKSPVTMKFEVIGMKIAPAGTEESGTGHHHVVIDGPAGEEGETIPADETHLHYGKGQTEGVVELRPGKHTLTLQFADGLHRSYGAGMRQVIEIEVVP